MHNVMRLVFAIPAMLTLLVLAACANGPASNQPPYWTQHQVGNMGYPAPLPQGNLATTTRP